MRPLEAFGLIEVGIGIGINTASGHGSVVLYITLYHVPVFCYIQHGSIVARSDVMAFGI